MTPKNAAAVALGRKGGKARARKMTKKERSEAARKAIAARWAKKRENEGTATPAADQGEK